MIINLKKSICTSNLAVLACMPHESHKSVGSAAILRRSPVMSYRCTGWKKKLSESGFLQQFEASGYGSQGPLAYMLIISYLWLPLL